MSYLVATVLVLLGAVLLTVGAELFAANVSAAAARLGVGVVALGVLVAGAEPEELVTAVLAAAQGHPSLAAGDAVGANLVMLTLALGLAAVPAPLPTSRRVLEYAVAAAAAGGVALGFLWNGLLSRGEGVFLVLLFVAAVVWVWRRERVPPVVGEVAGTGAAEGPGGVTREPSRELLLLLAGVVAMVGGGLLALRGAVGLVDAFGVTESVVGLTALALATSAEMVALAWAARRRGVSEVVVAGVVGAVVYNATVTLGLAGLTRPLGIGLGSPVIAVAGLTAVLPLVLLAGHRGWLPRPVGVLLVAVYLAAAAWLFTG